MKIKFFNEVSKEKASIKRFTDEQLTEIKANPYLSPEEKVEQMSRILDWENKKYEDLSKMVFSKL